MENNAIRLSGGSDAWLAERARSYRMDAEGPAPEGTTDGAWYFESMCMIADAECLEELIDRRRLAANPMAAMEQACNDAAIVMMLARCVASSCTASPHTLAQAATDAPELSGWVGGR